MFKAKNEGQRANSLIRNRKTGHLRKVSLPRHPHLSLPLSVSLCLCLPLSLCVRTYVHAYND